MQLYHFGEIITFSLDSNLDFFVSSLALYNHSKVIRSTRSFFPLRLAPNIKSTVWNTAYVNSSPNVLIISVETTCLKVNFIIYIWTSSKWLCKFHNWLYPPSDIVIIFWNRSGVGTSTSLSWLDIIYNITHYNWDIHM